MAENVIELTADNFDTEVLEASMPVVVDFWAPWCGPCRALAPIIEQLASAVEGKAKVGKLDIDSAQSVAMNYNVSSIPTVIIFKNGEPAKVLVGLTNLQTLQDAVNALA